MAPELNLYFTVWSPDGRNAVLLTASYFRCSCTSNMTFVLHVLQITSKNTIFKSWNWCWWWMENMKWIVSVIYMSLATWTKVCFRVLLSHIELIVYNYMYLYDVWRSAVDKSLSVCVSVPRIRGGRATVSVKLCVCGIKII